MNGLGVGDLRDVRPEVLSAAARRVEEHRLAVVKVVETVLAWSLDGALRGSGGGAEGCSRCGSGEGLPLVGAGGVGGGRSLQRARQ